METRNLDTIQKEIIALKAEKEKINLEFTRNLSNLSHLNTELFKALEELNNKYDWNKLTGNLRTTKITYNISNLLNSETPAKYIKKTFITEEKWKDEEISIYNSSKRTYEEKISNSNLSYYDDSEQPPEKPDTSSQEYEKQKREFDNFEDKNFNEQNLKIELITKIKNDVKIIKDKLNTINQLEIQQNDIYVKNLEKENREKQANDLISAKRLEAKTYICKRVIAYLYDVVNLNQDYWDTKGHGKTWRLKMPERIGEFIKILNDNKNYPTEIKKFENIRQLCKDKLIEDENREKARDFASESVTNYLCSFFNPNVYKVTDKYVSSLTKLIVSINTDSLSQRELDEKLDMSEYQSKAVITINKTPKFGSSDDDNL